MVQQKSENAEIYGVFRAPTAFCGISYIEPKMAWYLYFYSRSKKNVFFVYRERYIDRGKSAGCRKRWHTAKFRIRESAKKQVKLPKRRALKIRTDSAKIAGRYRNGGKILGACPGAFYVFPLPEFPLPERYFFRYSFGVTPHSFLK